MKKEKIAFVIIASAVALGGAGCGSKEPVPVMPVQNGCVVEGKYAPEWVCGLPKSLGPFVAAGKASANALGENYALREARADAREHLLVKLEDALYAQIAAVLQAQKVSEASRLKIAKKASRNALGTSKMLRTWTSSSGARFVLESVENDAVIDAAVGAMKAFVEANGYDPRLSRELEANLRTVYASGKEPAVAFTR